MNNYLFFFFSLLSFLVTESHKNIVCKEHRQLKYYKNSFKTVSGLHICQIKNMINFSTAVRSDILTTGI